MFAAEQCVISNNISKWWVY